MSQLISSRKPHEEDWNAEKYNLLTRMRQLQAWFFMYSYTYLLNFNADTITFKYLFLQTYPYF